MILNYIRNGARCTTTIIDSIVKRESSSCLTIFIGNCVCSIIEWGCIDLDTCSQQGKVKTLARVRKDVLNALTELGQLVEIPPAEGALYVLLRVNARDTTDLDLARRLIRDYGVAVIPGVAFGLKGDCFLRISYAGVVENSVSAGIKRLVQGITAIVGNAR